MEGSQRKHETPHREGPDGSEPGPSAGRDAIRTAVQGPAQPSSVWLSSIHHFACRSPFMEHVDRNVVCEHVKTRRSHESKNDNGRRKEPLWPIVRDGTVQIKKGTNDKPETKKDPKKVNYGNSNFFSYI